MYFVIFNLNIKHFVIQNWSIQLNFARIFSIVKKNNWKVIKVSACVLGSQPP